MDRTSIIGLLLGFIAIGVGMILKGVDVAALINPAAILIILLGTAAAVIIAFPSSTIKTIPGLLKIIFTEQKQTDNKELVRYFSELADLTRKEGLLSLEMKIPEADDPFTQLGLQLVVDGHPSEYIRDLLLEKIEAMERRHEEGAAVFTQAGTYAPTLGVLGAVVGLIAALADMSDTDTLGYAISSAFVATLLGIFTGYVMWHPFANKLREKSKKEVMQKEMIVEGILSITNGNSSRMVREKLSSYLSTKELIELEQEDQDA